MFVSVLRRVGAGLKPSYVVTVTRVLSGSGGPSFSDSKVGRTGPEGLTNGAPADQTLSEQPTNGAPALQTSSEQDRYESDVKNRILDASLQFVPVHGWSKEAISAGAETLGYPGVIHGMFPRGGFDLVQHFYTECNRRVVDHLIAHSTDLAADPPQPLREEGGRRGRIEGAVRLRLEMVEPYIAQWPQALALMSLPPNVPTSLANLLTLVDDIFYYTGDRSVDLSWYSRRVVLAGIYKATELFMLQDASAGRQRTWEFLGRRLDEAEQVKSYLESTGQASRTAKDIATSAFITARSMLGLSWNR